MKNIRYSKSLLNTAIRLSFGALRLLFLVLASEGLSDSDYVALITIFSTVQVAVTLIGGEVHIDLTRMLMIGRRPKSCFELFFYYYSAAVPYYIIGFMVCLLFLWLAPFPAGVASMIVLAFVLEYLSTELGRLLIALRRPVGATLIIVSRQGLWVLPAIYIFFAGAGLSLENVLALWLGGLALSVIYGGKRLISESSNWERESLRLVDAKFSNRDARNVGQKYLLSTLLVRLWSAADKWLVAAFFLESQAAAYAFYFSIMNVAPAIVGPAVLEIARPFMVEKNHNYRSTMKALHGRGVVLACTLLALLVIILMISILSFYEIRDPINNAGLLLVAAGSAIFRVINMAHGQVYFSAGLDLVNTKACVLGTLIAAVVAAVVGMMVGWGWAVWFAVMAPALVIYLRAKLLRKGIYG